MTEIAPTTPSLNAYLKVFSRRRRSFFVATIAALLVVAAVVTLWPAYYRSTATILIEQQEIPNDMVRTTISSFADQRLQMIQQRVMTRDNLLRLASKYDLYPDDRDAMASEELLQLVGSRISMNLVSGQFIDPRRGIPTEATIAFEIGFTDRSPDNAFKVANELYTLYHEENLKNRSDLVRETSSFLEAEARKLDLRVKDLEARVAKFKQQHVDELPELLDVNWQLYERTDAELREIARNRRLLEDQAIFLESELAVTSPFTGVMSESGARILSPADRLTALQSEMAQVQARYSPEHPDVLRIRSDIESLQEEVSARDRTRALYSQLEQLRGELAGIRERYSDEHPDVVLLSTQIRSLIRTLGDKVDDSKFDVDPTNPAYIQLNTRLQTTKLEIASLQDREEQARQKLAEFERRIARTPNVERTFSELAREYQNAAQKFAEVKQKQLEAELAESLEQDRKGEKFTLIDPPRVPETPVSPNRLLLGLIGSALALGIGLGVVALLEAQDDRVYGREPVLQAFGDTPMMAVPVIVSPVEVSSHRKRRYLWLGVMLLLGVGALAAVHQLVMPLDGIIAILTTRYGFGS